MKPRLGRPLKVKVAPCFQEIMDANGWHSLVELAQHIGFTKEAVYEWNERLLEGRTVDLLEKHHKAAAACGISAADWFAMLGSGKPPVRRRSA